MDDGARCPSLFDMEALKSYPLHKALATTSHNYCAIGFGTTHILHHYIFESWGEVATHVTMVCGGNVQNITTLANTEIPSSYTLHKPASIKVSFDSNRGVDLAHLTAENKDAPHSTGHLTADRYSRTFAVPHPAIANNDILTNPSNRATIKVSSRFYRNTVISCIKATVLYYDFARRIDINPIIIDLITID
jgi:hypothetical protein